MKTVLRTFIKPWGRAAYYGFKYRSACWQAASTTPPTTATQSQARPPAFIIGCGRSGTTLLGEMMSLHQQVRYMFEPYHLWAAVDRMTDACNLFCRINARCLMSGSDFTPEAKWRFEQVFGRKSTAANPPQLIEKTPLNTLRIGYLRALAPDAKFVHIVRDGLHVSASIDRLATGNRYRIAGRPEFNQWWGVSHAKWRSLVEDGMREGYFPKEIGLLHDNLRRGAYEWLVSMGEVDRWRDVLGDHLLEVNYEHLIADPHAVLSSISDFLDLVPSDVWLDKAVARVEDRIPTSLPHLTLPRSMCEAFNAYQQHHGFACRADLEGWALVQKPQRRTEPHAVVMAPLPLMPRRAAQAT